jgi:putative endonuclease
MGGWVYMMTNRRDGTLYVGVASDLPRRVYQHRESPIAGFAKRYGLKMLVYYEQHDDIRIAIQREKTIKHWPRAWKVTRRDRRGARKSPGMTAQDWRNHFWGP